MPKINVMLSDDAHLVLNEYKRLHKSHNLDEALDSLLKDYARKGQLFRKV